MPAATRYTAEDGAIVGRNLPHFANRPIYCNNSDLYIAAGDRPLIRLIKRRRVLGALELSAETAAGPLPLQECADISMRYRPGLIAWELRDKRLGIVGMGEIGCELALRANVMGMRTAYYKRTPLNAELERRFSAEYRDLPALLRESDYVVLAVPHTADTERMIGAEQLALMKPDAYLVNICRGGVVDEEALIAALREGRIAGAGLDVFTFEPLPFDSPLCHMHNVILTPHIGGGSGANRVIELTDALTELRAILHGAAPRVRLD